MISSQRLILMAVILNILIGLSVTISEAPTDYQTNQDEITAQTQQLEDFEVELKEETTETGGRPETGEQTEQKTTGNPVKLSSMIWKTAINGLNPFSITGKDVTTEIEKIATTALWIFRGLMAILMGFELYVVIFNKKGS